MSVYDMSGKLLQQMKTKNNVTKLGTQALVQGVYLVTIKTDTNKTANAKLIKK
ncbi:T9SS type A sorting domain-containing protein [Chryseobacterium rhizosphaerae]|uniref:T9SS type A sorting domain-containing protein n=1 Tax=Chryseobacterium rhizosphaerae TaxID=395937 RepID=UPI0021D20EF1|nr:T9SS type A sorting domain-containing protein [Chryseobacterium rhizosphaerae]